MVVRQHFDSWTNFWGVYCQGFSSKSIEIIWWWMIGTVTPSLECSGFDIKEFAFLQSWSQYSAVSQARHAFHYPGRVGCVAHFCKQPLSLLLTWHVDCATTVARKMSRWEITSATRKETICVLSLPLSKSCCCVSNSKHCESYTRHLPLGYTNTSQDLFLKP